MAKKSITRVSRAQLFQVAKKLEEFVKSDLNGRLTWKQLADRFSGELGFGIADVTIAGVVKDMGLAVTVPGGNTNAAKTTGGRIKVLEQRTNVLEAALRHLYEKLGEPMPKDLLSADPAEHVAKEQANGQHATTR